MIWIEGGNLAFETTVDTMTNAALNVNIKWRHYAFVRNGNNLDFYLDGAVSYTHLTLPTTHYV